MTEPATPIRRTRQHRPLLVYSALGPLLSLVLAVRAGTLADPSVWTLVAFQVLVAAVVFAILRPGSYRRSVWRAMCAALVLVGPVVLMAASSMPVFVLLEPTPGRVGLDLGSPNVWAALWLAGGLVGCSVVGLLSAAGGVVPAGPATRDSGPVAPGTRSEGPRSKAYIRLVAVAFILFVVTLGTGGFYYVLSFPFALAQSHVEANVPGVADFDAYLERDLSSYFRANDSSVTRVRYDLLRRGPTQTGIAYPKYYAWVTVTSAHGPAHEGIVRLAAVERTRFEVTDYLSRDSVLSNPGQVREHFPAALSENIVRRARAAW